MKSFAVGIIVVWVLWALFVLSIWGGIAYTAAHFINKLW